MTSFQQIIDANIKLTPMMVQYFEIKKQYPDTIVLYRMGDFYELFFDDAKKAAQILNIALTHRGKLGDYPIPMAGIPHHAASTYIDRITARGLKAVICEQIEDPKEAKGIVKRAVTQIVSPGIPYDLDKSASLEARYIASAVHKDGTYYLALLDFTTGNFLGIVTEDEREFLEKVTIYAPKEFLSYQNQWANNRLIEDFFNTAPFLKTKLPEEIFDAKESSFYLEKLIPNFKRDKTLQNFQTIFSPTGAISYYIYSTQGLEQLYHIRPFRLESKTGLMQVTLSTLSSLEILPRAKDRYHESLLGFLDKTKTAVGARYLKEIFIHPLFDLNKIHERQQSLEFFLHNPKLIEETQDFLGEVRDIERILAKLSTKKINSQDLGALTKSIQIYEKLKNLYQKFKSLNFCNLSNTIEKNLKKIEELILTTINLELGASLEKGNLIKEGYNKTRDKLANLSLKANDELIKLESKYRQKTGINNLKIKYNNLNGYFIEVSKSHVNKVPKSFERRQTLVNVERFTSDELIEFEKEIITAKEKLERLEKELFESVLHEITLVTSDLMSLSQHLAKIDVAQSFAQVALSENFSKPQIDENKKILNIQGAWHPLIKSLIKDEFVTHNLNLNEEKYFGLITGPNMAGKTTVMREMAIIQFLAQIGSYVPAKTAQIGLCNALYSRLGASDDILRGQSTFMLEMTETAEILRHANEKSLIIIDEIGRGTSTYDGLSIAWALVEYFINQTKAITLFSTHYHELIELADSLKEAKNLTVETINLNGNVKFLYRLIEQGATQSFGIHVAKLAGLPRLVLERSGQILKELEEKNHNHNPAISTDQLAFDFESKNEFKTIKDEFEKVDLNNMTPLQAMQKLHELQRLFESN